jgi:hypothetical protein
MMLMRRLPEPIDVEWTTSTLGYLSIPMFIAGIVLFSFSDYVVIWFRSIKQSYMKPNSNFESLPIKEDSSPLTERVMKNVGVILIVGGIAAFFFSESIYVFINRLLGG